MHRLWPRGSVYISGYIVGKCFVAGATLLPILDGRKYQVGLVKIAVMQQRSEMV
jgi:hypothetical protein